MAYGSLVTGPGIEPVSLALADGFFTTEPPGKPHEGFLNSSQLHYRFISMETVLVSYCYRNKWPQMQGFKTTDVYYTYELITLTAHEVRGPKQFFGLKPRSWQGGIPSGSSRDESVSLPLPASTVSLHPSFMIPSFALISASIPTSSLSLTLLPPSPKDSCDYTGPTQILQDILPISTSLISSHLHNLYAT